MEDEQDIQKSGEAGKILSTQPAERAAETADSVSGQPPNRGKAEVEQALGKVAVRGLQNLYHAITNKDCEPYVALGMATSAVSTMKRSHAALVAALESIANSPHCSYDSYHGAEGLSYATGVADGHRCAANMARAALADAQIQATASPQARSVSIK
jgi:hypothetical protein